MSPKEKAEILVGQYLDIQTKIEWTENVETLKKCETLNSEIYEDVDKYWRNLAKQSALVAVNECIESTKQLVRHYTKGDDKRYASIYLSMSLSVEYLQQVKKEIEKL